MSGAPPPASIDTVPARRGRRCTPVFRVREPAFWVFAVIVALTAVTTLADQSLIRRLSPGGWALSWGLLVLYALPVFAIVYVLDLYEREPLPLVLAAFIWGAIAATQLAGIADAGWGVVVARAGGPEFASRWTAALTAPFVEETLKGLGVLLVFLMGRDQADDMMDGFVYGAICGLGFAVVEDVVYFVAVFGGTTSGVLQGFFVRVLASGLYGHVLYTGLVGMGIGYALSSRRDASRAGRAAALVGLSAAAVLGHFLWNSPFLDFLPAPPWRGAEWILVPLATAAKGAPLLLFVVLAVVLARGRERRWLRSALDPELGGSAITRLELLVLEDPRRRRRSRRDMRSRAGPAAAGLLRRLQREQIQLAVARAKAEGESDGSGEQSHDVVRQRAVCASLRHALVAIPGAAPAAGSPPAAPAAGSPPAAP